ncbi:glutamyl-tRNA(Gln) amidotransferase, subunit E [Thermoplasmatales archaeon BRNA1]|nr:glutamyl-tRNA(Gln) amidotransferase, subunit E [Thermoplasmatales archaeon BRNA1]
MSENETDGMMCGIEIHQQLDTKKLFCNCDSCLSEEGSGAIYRRLRPTTSEMGEVDRAALAQFNRGYGYQYQSCPGTTCLVELDEEPPHEVNADSMETTLIFSELVHASVIDEVQFMRKIVVDGSNTSGFQRTSLVAVDGYVEAIGRKIGILSVCLEEDACRKIDTTDTDVVWRTDRLGIPLIEVATAPDMRTPQEVMEVALRIGTLLRATKRVKRGIGTIREDLNISIPEGARIEIKGVQELRMLPDFVTNEVKRQKMLVRVKKILAERGTKAVPVDLVDVTDIFKTCESKIIVSALKDKGRVLACRLPGFAGVMNGDNKTLRLGSEMAQYARTVGVKGIFHSDELPNYGIEQEYVDRLREALGMTGEFDAFVICAAKEKKAKDALTLAVNRANAALEGVPEETRDPLPDGTTKYSRPLPGAARMYPETDVPPTPITRQRLDRIARNLPELPEVTEARLVKQYGINEQQSHQIVAQGRDDVFCKIADEFGMAAVAATTFQNTFSELEHEGINTDALTYDDMYNVFAGLKENRFAKEAIPALLKEIASGTDMDAAIMKLGLTAVDAGEAEAIIAKIVREREEFVRSKGMAAIGPLMGPVMGALRGKIDGKQASDILTKEIRKLLG